MSVAGKVAVVTGGSMGIGRATCLQFARKGANVVVADINDAKGEETASEVRGLGAEAIYVHCDVSKSTDVQNLINRTVQHFGRIDCLFNNAGNMIGKNILDITEEDFYSLMNIHVLGTVLGCKYAIPHMLKQGGGAIVNMASISGLVGLPEQSAYCAAKGAVLQLTRQIAVDYSRHGIRCNAVCPGSIETEVLKQYLESLTPEQRQALLDKHPIGRFGKPEEVANAVVWLCSDEASFITGAPISVDGGYVAQ